MGKSNSAPSSTLFRILKWTLAALLVLLVVAILAIELMSWNFLKGPITDRVEAMTGREMEITGDISVSLLPRPHLDIGEMTLANASWARTPEMVAIDSLKLEPSLTSLLQGELALENVVVRGPTVNLESRAEKPGNWVLPAMTKPGGTPDKGTSATEGSGQPEEDQAGPPVSIQRLNIYDAEIRYAAPGTDQPQVLSIASLTTSGDRVSLNAEADLGMSGERLVIPAELSATMDPGFEDSQWHLREIQARVGDVRIDGNLGVDTGTAPVTLRGELHSPSINITEMLTALPESPEGGPPGIAIPVLPDLAGDIHLSIDELILEPATFTKVEIRLLPGQHQLTLETLDFQVAGGRGEASADLTSNEDFITAEVQLDLQQADLHALGLGTGPGQVLDVELDLGLDQIQQAPSLSPETLLKHLDLGVATAHYRTTEQHAGPESDLELKLEKAGEPPRPAFSANGEFRGRDLEMTVEGGPLTDLAGDLSDYRLQAQARSGELYAWADTSLGSLMTPASISGNLVLDGSDGQDLEALAGTTLPPLPEFRLSGRINRDGEQWSVTSLEGNVGVTELDGEVHYRIGSPPTVNADLQAGRIELAQFMGDDTSPGSSPGDGAGDQSPLAALRSIDGQLNLRAQTLVLPGAPELRNLRLDAGLDSGRLEIEPLDFDVAGGSWASSLELAAANEPATGSIDAEFDNINLSRFGDTFSAIEDRLGILSGDVHVEITESLTAAQQEDLALPSIDRLVLQPSTLRFTDAETDTDMTLDLRTRGLDANDQAFHIDGDGQYDGSPFSLTFRGDRLLDARKPERPYSLDLVMNVVDSRIHVDGSILQPLALKGLSLRLELEGPNPHRLTRLLGIPLPDLPPYSLSGNLDYADQRWMVTDIEGEVGDSDLSGQLGLDTGPRPPHLSADLRSETMDLADLGVLVGAEPHPAKSTPEDDDGDLLPDQPLVTSAWQDLSADVRYRGKNVRAADIPLSDVEIEFELADGQGHFKPVRFGVGKGQVDFNLSLDARQDPPEGTLGVEVQAVNLSEVLGNWTLTDDAVGIVGGQGKFWITGSSIAEFFASADGGMVVLMSQGKMDALLVELAGLDAGQAFLSWLRSRDPIPIDCAYIDLQARDGVAIIDTLAIDTADTTFTGTGTVNLNNELLDLTLTAHPKDVSVFSGRTPFHIGGSLSEPEPGIQSDNLALRVGGSVVLAAVAAPVAALLPLLDLGTGEEIGYCEGLASRSLEAINDELEDDDDPDSDEG
ncbi:hypothetical protein SAMN05216203_0145 [Marinobacter daqiaonensis]|uniref:AsmA domain-containing protein n=1 Tax=Marinobacter daqiaonensis TaxID=650891 RepID=A0A1I6GIQ3_9GAMM|nr:AsmA family protein [Marinobacter daqiaonensis]SFR42056.1 hypothetical protein SAMN05216203_0145 [Marinobacter daqiaonensis]